MNWTLLLSEYPRAILEDDRAISLLAILERHGALSEEELLPHAASRLELADRLLELHRNQLIETTPEIVRLTLRGKKLLDRFQLPDAIIEDVVSSLWLPAKESDPYRHYLAACREHAFPLYLDSLSRVHAWNTFHDRITLRRAKFSLNEQIDSAKGLGRLVVLLDAIRNWFVNYPEVAATTVPEVGAQLDAGAAQRLHVQFKYYGDRSAEAERHLAAAVTKGADYWRESSGDRGIDDTLAVFLSCQRERPRNEWLTAWTHARRAADSGEYVVDALRRFLGAYDSSEEIKRVVPASVDRDDFISANQDASSLLGALLASPTLEAFAESTGQTARGARLMVEMLNSQCARLLAENVSDDSQVLHPEQPHRQR